MKIGFLGGTFDPIHKGHLSLAQAAKKQYKLDQVIFVPARIPPHKTDRQVTPVDDRLHMTELALKQESDFKLSRVEIDRSEPSFTIETLRQFKKEYPDDEIFLIMGSDSLKELSTWREPEAIQQLANLLVAVRRDAEFSKQLGTGILKIDMPLCPISSTEIRNEIRSEKSVTRWLVPDVEHYIREKGLYRPS